MKGATRLSGQYDVRHHDFNPRTREGCDAGRLLRGQHQRRISIHAPVKGATNIKVRCYFFDIYFNPRTREGCDSYTSQTMERRKYFNPRTREGCD